MKHIIITLASIVSVANCQTELAKEWYRLVDERLQGIVPKTGTIGRIASPTKRMEASDKPIHYTSQLKREEAVPAQGSQGLFGILDFNKQAPAHHLDHLHTTEHPAIAAGGCKLAPIFDRVLPYDTSIGMSNEKDICGKAIEKSVYGCFVAPMTQEYAVGNCGYTSERAQIAVYLGCDCPPREEDLISCNDEGCGIATKNTPKGTLTVFNAHKKRHYLIQVSKLDRYDDSQGKIVIAPFA
eukprot:GHVU01217309.1.p1 GENE.GHVU01217309.1~~GHVU01217309.1.p1  ORF type:complete len:240 (+),score=41.32 GHVU01217309.1:71-790(+)